MCVVRATDDTGVELNAEYDVVPDGEHLALVLHSAGGSAAGSPHSRNHQYAPALTLLLARLSALHAVLVSAFVDSRNVQHLPEAERALISAPVELDQRSDPEELRRELTRAQGRVGQPADAAKSGNNSKRIRLRLAVPGFAPADARHLEVDLSRRSSATAPVAVQRSAPRNLLVSFSGFGSDEPVAVLWAVGQVAAGHGRLFERSEFTDAVGPLLTEFGQAGSAPDELFRQLAASADLWEVADARAGFTRSAEKRLHSRWFRARVVDVLRRDHVTAIVDFDGLLAEVGLADHGDANETALDVLRPLVQKPLTTVNGSPNKILEVDGRKVLVATGRSPRGRPVLVADVQRGLDLLRENGSVGINPEELGHRSAFIGAVLSTLPEAQASTGPAVVTLTGPAEKPAPEDPTYAVLDGKALRKYRKEQSGLRRVLAGNRSHADCDLCGHELPMEMLVAAHIKPRAECTDEERNDLRNVAMLACRFGCDHLFENGYVTVDHTGLVVASAAEADRAGVVGDHLERLHGRVCTAHRPESEQYFAWHRANNYRRGPATA